MDDPSTICLDIEAQVVVSLPSPNRTSVPADVITCHNYETGTQQHIQRMPPHLHNSHPGGADTQSMLVPSMINTNLNYDTSTHSQRSTALRPYQGSVYFEYDSQLFVASRQNPAEHVRASCYPSNNHNTCAGISMPLLDYSPDRQREFGNRLSPMAPLSNQPSHDAVITIPAAGEFASVPQTTHVEERAIGDDETSRHSRANRDDEIARHLRAIRDDEIAGHSTFFKTLVPVNFSSAYQVAGVGKQIFQSIGLPVSIKLFGLLTVGFAFAAGFSSLVGLSISTFRPNTLPFGSNPRAVIRKMHNVVVHTTAYAFMWAICLWSLQDDPLLMWIAAGFFSVVFVIIRRLVNMREGCTALSPAIE